MPWWSFKNDYLDFGPYITSYRRVMPLSLILARDFMLTISSWLIIQVTLKHLAVFALVSVPFLTGVDTVIISLFVTSDFGFLNRISAWLCPAQVSVWWGCIMAKVLGVWLHTGTNLLCAGGISFFFWLLLLSRAVFLIL